MDPGWPGASQVFNSWNTAIKLAWLTPRPTRTYLVQQVLSVGQTSTKVNILSRYRNFFPWIEKISII